MVLNTNDTCVSGVKDSEAVLSNEIPELVSVEKEEVRCKMCGFLGAVIHHESWSDGLNYSDYHCKICGYTEVL